MAIEEFDKKNSKELNREKDQNGLDDSELEGVAGGAGASSYCYQSGKGPTQDTVPVDNSGNFLIP